MVQTPVIPPVDKLPLAARKDIRDEFDAKLEDITKSVNEILGETYKLEINFNQFYAYGAAADSSYAKSSPGSCARQYFESFVYNLKRFTDDGKFKEAIDDFNNLITDRRIAIEADNQFSYSGCSVKGGTFEINFNTSCPGTNVDYACSEIAKEFDKGLFAASPNSLPVAAKRGLRDDWDTKKEDLLAKFKEELLGAEVKLMADYEALWKALVDGKAENKDVDLESAARNFGSTLNSYFEGLKDQIAYQFKKDDMMCEGFTEAVPSGEIWVDVAPEKTKLKDSYSECEIKDGKFYLRTVPRYFGTNAYYVASKLVDML